MAQARRQAEFPDTSELQGEHAEKQARLVAENPDVPQLFECNDSPRLGIEEISPEPGGSSGSAYPPSAAATNLDAHEENQHATPSAFESNIPQPW